MTDVLDLLCVSAQSVAQCSCFGCSRNTSNVTVTVITDLTDCFALNMLSTLPASIEMKRQHSGMCRGINIHRPCNTSNYVVTCDDSDDREVAAMSAGSASNAFLHPAHAGREF